MSTGFVYSFYKSIKMFRLLTQYFLQTHKLYVPGTGAFSLHSREAVNDFTSQMVHAPGWDIVFTPFAQNAVASPDQDNEKLYEWLAVKLNVSKEDAVIRYDDFCDGLKTDIQQGKTVRWEGLGTLEKINNRVIFTAESSVATLFTGVTAKKVLRENVSHNVLVGERETTSEEMRARLTSKKSRSGVGVKIAWIVLLVALIFLAVYFLRNGCNVNALGNQTKSEVTKPSETYRLR